MLMIHFFTARVTPLASCAAVPASVSSTLGVAGKYRLESRQPVESRGWFDGSFQAQETDQGLLSHLQAQEMVRGNELRRKPEI